MARPRTPTALKLVKGTAQPCRTNKREPKPVRQVPSPPAHLSDRAKTAWGAVSVVLDRMGVLTEADPFALESLCETYADLVDARQKLRLAVTGEIVKDGVPQPFEIAKAGELTYVTTGASGPMLRARPETALIADADRRFSMWLAKFGMTPADRSRVSANVEEQKENPWDSL